MLNENDFWYWDNVIPKEECDKIINLYPDKWKRAEIKEQIIDINTKGKVDDLNRISECIFLIDEWVFQMALGFIKTANEKSGWNYDIESLETMQLTKYPTGGFYGWHKDGGSDIYGAYQKPDDPLIDGMVRKLSMTILLNDDYEGGEFQFKFADNKRKGLDKVAHGLKTNTLTPPLKGVGSVIVFPSYLLHRVKPVTKGTRYSLVVWSLGPPFK